MMHPRKSPVRTHRRWAMVFLAAALLAAGCDDGEDSRDSVLDAGTLPPLTLLEDRDPDPGVVEIDLEARESVHAFAPGVESTVWTYNGLFAGPLIRAKVGQELVVHFRNRLPDPTTIHWHGLRLPADMDGVVGPGPEIPPDGEFVYRFELLDEGTYWFHPHVNASEQIVRGLFGMLVVEGKTEPDLGPERELILSDALIDGNGALVTPGGAAESDSMSPMRGYQGSHLMVNGVAEPTLVMTTGRERWRMLNASASRYYRLALPGLAVHQIGSEGGRLSAPVPLEEWLLAPGERVDLVVEPKDGGPGSAALVNRTYDRGHDTAEPDAAVMNVRWDGDAAPGGLPPLGGSLESLPEPTAEREFVLTEAAMSDDHEMPPSMPMFFINGNFYPNVPPVEVALGDVEDWLFVNETEMDHPMHLHGFRFQVVERDGEPEGVLAWKDTVNVRAMTTVRVRVAYDGFPGMWMYHCHILEHAELGMMGELMVNP